MTTSIDSIAAKFSAGEGYLEDRVLEAVRGLSHVEFSTLADLSLDPGGASANGFRAEYFYPNFADATMLGGFGNLEAAQKLMQDIYNAAISRLKKQNHPSS